MYNGRKTRTSTRSMEIAAFSESLHADKGELPHQKSCACVCHFSVYS